MKSLIYLHGFNSSPHSEKACLTRAYFEAESSRFRLHIPTLPSKPLEAIDTIDALIHSLDEDSLAGFIGSSLGGYYSLYLQYRYQLPVVLINPAIKPYTLLLDYLGENVNLYTGERYVVEKKHMDELKSLSVPSIATTDNTFLLTMTGDEVLDFQQAVSFLPNAKMWVAAGGDHSFCVYPCALPAIVNFFQ